MRRLLRWIVRNGLFILGIALALSAAVGLKIAVQGANKHESDYHALSDVKRELEATKAEWTRTFEESTAAADKRKGPDLENRIARTQEKIDNEEALLIKGPRPIQLLRNSRQRLVDNEQRKLRIALYTRQLATLEAAHALVNRREAEAKLIEADRRCAVAIDKLEELEDRNLAARLHSRISGEHKDLTDEQRTWCDRRDAARKARDKSDTVKQVQEKYQASKRDLEKKFNHALRELSADQKRARTDWTGSAVERAQLFVAKHGILWRALLAWLGFIVLPYVIRLVFWFVIAPLAEKTGAIRLAVAGGRGATIPPAEPSTTAVAIQLDTTEELLVRQSHVQTTAQGGNKATQLLLDWHHPLASIASGLTSLTRIRGAGETTSVSAVTDPFAEVTILTLPDGASCVLQPRALAAVIQPVNRPLRVKSHWRLWSPSAWLTLQLRYLVFHGPCSLVIKGGRGVRVERADRGRIFGQAQLIGFSADLDYSVTRTETFWPYFRGWEPLFKDKVEPGEGVLVIEEVPIAGRKKAGAGRGLEEAVEVMTKAIGI